MLIYPVSLIRPLRTYINEFFFQNWRKCIWKWPLQNVVPFFFRLQCVDNKSFQQYHGWPSTQPGSLHTALQRQYTQPCSLFSQGTAVWTMRARLCEQWGTAVCKYPAVYRVTREYIQIALSTIQCTVWLHTKYISAEKKSNSWVIITSYQVPYR